MEKFERDGIIFTTFEHNGETYFCTGNPTGKLKIDFIGELGDYCTVIGATSVVSGKDKTVDELYSDWLSVTEFERNELGIEY